MDHPLRLLVVFCFGGSLGNDLSPRFQGLVISLREAFLGRTGAIFDRNHSQTSVVEATISPDREYASLLDTTLRRKVDLHQASLLHCCDLADCEMLSEIARPSLRHFGKAVGSVKRNTQIEASARFVPWLVAFDDRVAELLHLLRSDQVTPGLPAHEEEAAFDPRFDPLQR